MKSYVIHLLRHGLTSGNIEGRYVGRTDVDLDKQGAQQLSELADRYNYGNPRLVYSSPLKRCHQTIEKIFGECDIIDVEGLRECNMGDFEGKTSAELIDDPKFTDWVQHGVAPPNGESNKDFATRVCKAFIATVKDILTKGETEAVICAHGGVIMTLLAVYSMEQREMMEYMASNGRGFSIRVTPSIWMRTGMVEVIGVYPPGSDNEPDLSQNPAKQTAEMTGSNAFAGVTDEAGETNEYFWADAPQNDKPQND